MRMMCSLESGIEQKSEKNICLRPPFWTSDAVSVSVKCFSQVNCSILLKNHLWWGQTVPCRTFILTWIYLAVYNSVLTIASWKKCLFLGSIHSSKQLLGAPSPLVLSPPSWVRPRPWLALPGSRGCFREMLGSGSHPWGSSLRMGLEGVKRALLSSWRQLGRALKACERPEPHPPRARDY